MNNYIRFAPVLGVLACLPLHAAAGQATIAEAVQQVKDLARRPGVTHRDVARLVTRIVDERITNANDWDLPGSEHDQIVNTPAGKAKLRQFNAERETLGINLGKNFGNEYAVRAEWAWNLRYGNCNETSAIAYRILKDSGFTKIKMLETGANGGHAFVVLNMTGGDVADPRTWGGQAFVVDGWRHRELSAAEAFDDPWVGGGGKHQPNDQTSNYDDPRLYARYRKLITTSHSSALEEAQAILRAIKERQGQAAGPVAPTGWTAGRKLAGPVSLPAKKSEPTAVGVTLEKGKAYVIVGAGTCSLWDGQNDGCDSVYRYRSPLERNGGPQVIWGQLRLVDPNVHLSELIERQTRKKAIYNASHQYAAVVIGEGKALKAVVHDGGGYGDNHGALKVSVYEAVKTQTQGTGRTGAGGGR